MVVELVATCQEPVKTEKSGVCRLLLFGVLITGLEFRLIVCYGLTISIKRATEQVEGAEEAGGPASSAGGN